MNEHKTHLSLLDINLNTYSDMEGVTEENDTGTLSLTLFPYVYLIQFTVSEEKDH